MLWHVLNESQEKLSQNRISSFQVINFQILATTNWRSLPTYTNLPLLIYTQSKKLEVLIPPFFILQTLKTKPIFSHRQLLSSYGTFYIFWRAKNNSQNSHVGIKISPNFLHLVVPCMCFIVMVPSWV